MSTGRLSEPELRNRFHIKLPSETDFNICWLTSPGTWFTSETRNSLTRELTHEFSVFFFLFFVFRFLVEKIWSVREVKDVSKIFDLSKGKD